MAKRVVEVWTDTRVFEFLQPEWAEDIVLHWHANSLWVEAVANGRIDTMGFFPMTNIRAVVRKEAVADA